LATCAVAHVAAMATSRLKIDRLNLIEPTFEVEIMTPPRLVSCD
jgi:hypothetical protein